MRIARKLSRGCTALGLAAAVGLPSPSVAAPLRNAVVGDAGSIELDHTRASTWFEVVGRAFTEAVAEISPDDIGVGSADVEFQCEILPMFLEGDEGMREVAITVPDGYSRLRFQNLAVAGVLQESCGAPSQSQPCHEIDGSRLSVRLDETLRRSSGSIVIRFVATAPLHPGRSEFRVAGIGPSGAEAIAAGNADQDPSNANSLWVRVHGLALEPAAPNPCDGITVLRFDVPGSGPTRLELFDIAGRRVRTLVEAQLPAGSHAVEWNGRDEQGRLAASGCYVYRLSTGRNSQTGRLVLVR